MNLFGFVENLALEFPKTKPIAISFLCKVILSGIHKGESFCSSKPTFIGLGLALPFQIQHCIIYSSKHRKGYSVIINSKIKLSLETNGPIWVYSDVSYCLLALSTKSSLRGIAFARVC